MKPFDESRPIRIGILGAARIAPSALVRPAREVPGVQVFAVAARDPERARAFARKHDVPRVHSDYAELLADPELDAVYNPLPNGLHCEWTLRALEAGKHVLCEKPMAANAEEAARMASAARAADRLLVEAFHWRYHPLAERMQEIVTSGLLGEIRHIEAALCFPLPVFSDIRYRLDLAGGATMDAGCYPINLIRFLAAAEPEVVSARARLASPDVDRCMSADFRFEDGRTARFKCSMFSADLLRITARVRGDRGELHVFNWIAPHIFHRLTLRTRDGRSTERVAGSATYTHQLQAFAKLVRGEGRMSSDAEDAVRNMRVIDEVYRHAGLRVRGTPP